MAVGPNRSWLHILSFALITVTVIYVVIDVEYPRAGLIRLGSFDQVLVEVRADMDQTIPPKRSHPLSKNVALVRAPGRLCQSHTFPLQGKPDCDPPSGTLI